MTQEQHSSKHPFAVKVRVGFEHIYFIAAEDAASAVAQVESFPGLQQRIADMVANPADFVAFETLRGKEALEISPLKNEADFVQVFGEMFPESPVSPED